MYIPPQSIPCWIAPFGGISYRRGRSLLILIGKGLAGTSLQRISKSKVPRFFYIYTNGVFGANFPQIL